MTANSGHIVIVKGKKDHEVDLAENRGGGLKNASRLRHWWNVYGHCSGG